MHFQEARIFRRVRADDIAEVAGVSCSTISAWQQGSREPNPAQKRVVAAALAMDPRQITYGPPPGGFTRRNIHPSKTRTLAEVARLADGEDATPATAKAAKTVPVMPEEMAGVRVKNAKEATARIRAEVAPENGQTRNATEIVRGRSDPNLTHTPEAFDSSTWSVIRRMIETIGVDEAIRRLMLVR